MSAKVFCDSNIWVYSLERGDGEKAAISRKLLAEAQRTKHLVVSYQNFQEVLNVLSEARAAPYSQRGGGVYFPNCF